MHLATYAGVQFDFTDIKPENISPRDMAHALSHLCRFGGHTDTFYSVAEHLIHVYDEVKKVTSDMDTLKWALLPMLRKRILAISLCPCVC
jgi:hypothetical protein